MIRCLDFHRPEWVRLLHRYHVMLRNGSVFYVWAHDACDAVDSVEGSTVEEQVWQYGNGDPLGSHDGKLIERWDARAWFIPGPWDADNTVEVQ